MSSAGYDLVPNDAPEDGRGEKYALRPRPSRLVPILLGIICVQFIALVGALYSRRQLPAVTRLYTPVQDFVSEELKVYPLGFGTDLSPFQVPSSSELDDAWDDLYNFGISRITRDQAVLLPNKTSPIPGDPGFYIAELDVFHELHCLNMVRKALDPEYYPDWNINMVDRAREHVSHCVDWIRQAIMCHSDTSVLVWQWNYKHNQSTPIARVPHTCRNFERIQEWGREHAMVGEYNDTVHLEDDLPVPPYVY
ncbi:hypothetical protein DFH09DRAFT_1029141 [Mycena vulgaris]|nr:hypothetical protein DFH09DRAFT_1029141 [Mycena vulgaris]